MRTRGGAAKLSHHDATWKRALAPLVSPVVALPPVFRAALALVACGRRVRGGELVGETREERERGVCAWA
jgi:hypothetical protein